MFNTFRIRMVVAVAWVISLAGMWWGYGRLMAKVDLSPRIAAVEQALAQADWPATESAVQLLSQDWRRARPVAELNFGGGLLADFESGLARLEGSIATQSTALARVSLAELTVDWQGLRSPYPDGK